MIASLFMLRKRASSPLLFLVIHIFRKDECLTYTLNDMAPAVLPPGSNPVNGKKGLPVYHKVVTSGSRIVTSDPELPVSPLCCFCPPRGPRYGVVDTRQMVLQWENISIYLDVDVREQWVLLCE